MTIKKHPILTVSIIVILAGLLLGTTAIVAMKWMGRPTQLVFKKKIGVLPIEGPILESRKIITSLREFKKDQGIRAIVLRIDSPGGGVGPSQEIYREVRRTVRTKRVVASMGAVAASGGYYIAAAADRIVANPGTITGSIGVLMEFVRFEELLKKVGVSLEVLKSGEFKDLGSPHRKLTERDKQLIQEIIGDIRGQFVDAVARGRRLSRKEVDKIADGRIFTGRKAKELGLVDDLGNFHDAVAVAKRLAGIKGEVELVYPRKRGGGLWDLLFDSAADSIVRLIDRLKFRAEFRWDPAVHPRITEKY
ncbi:MAG: signal peptide peptidase SppA [Deltaproteobacteria bacterium]|nr:signal peptide peptidase SppA [Deltaproteobacteria bacterium]MBW1923826.1 signal peptide peptidase SppA [Deltaproteobacteria bacterium]MBW1948543.1 signal peptide peptidase SppA [Deltaproteobacteria bacterium]MBW2006971.1 signal peptide peptidase SppA [Deltaproteobacteria bacterium]MBW2102313.1 signal peptide peptidase SppA [Deltaproteobacteria bacterium]